MRPLPAREPYTDRCWMCGCRRTRNLRSYTNDYSLDPSVAGRHLEVRATQREITALVRDTGELACGHQRSFAEHRTITALEHARVLRECRGQCDGDVVVEQRPLQRYDQLTA